MGRSIVPTLGQVLFFEVNVYTQEAHTGTPSEVHHGQGSGSFLKD